MMNEDFVPPKMPHTLSKLNKMLCWILVFIMIVMFISYYITTLMQVRLTKLSSETIKLNNENVELQNKLDNQMSYNHVEELVGSSGILGPAKQVIEINDNRVLHPKKKKNNKKFDDSNYYKWALGF